MRNVQKDICETCTKCWWYWQNIDTAHECNGQENACREFVDYSEGSGKSS